jgi:hypothetical protein
MPKKQADKEEQDFQTGIKKTEWFKEYVKEYGEEPDLNTKDYDYRSAWKAGVRPQRDPYDKNRYHWSSSNPETGEMLKSKEHPTAWKEEYMKRTGKNPDEAGITKEQAGMAKGGAVKAKLQTKKLLQEGGMLQEGGTVDEESGNEVPVGAMQEEVRDDIPAKLSEGEFVFPADVVRYIGLERLMQMRQAAKEGLKKMEDMGQMSNADEATEEDDGEFESQLDEIFEEVEGEDKEETEMQVGGMAMPEGMTQEDAASTVQQTPEATPTGEPTLTPEQMSKIQETAKDMQNRKLNIDQTLMHAPTEGLTPSKIVTDSLAAEGYKGNTNVFLRSLTVRAAKKEAAIVRFSDTIFVGMPVDQSTMEVHLFTKDDPKKLQDSIKAGIQTLQNVGTTRIQTTTTNANLLSMLKKLQYPMSVQEDNGTFKLTMEIGK